MVQGPDPLTRLDTALAAGRRRLRLRAALRGTSLGVWAGAIGALGLAIARQIGLLDDAPAGIAAVVALLAAMAIGAVVGALWRGLDPRQTALLLDRALDTDELLVTATWLRDQPPSPRRDAVLGELSEARLPPLNRALPLRPPRHLRWVGLPLTAALLALLLPAWRPALSLRSAQSEEPLVQEGARLAERVSEGETSEAQPLPDGIEREIADLARDMQGDTLSPEEAMARLEEMQEQLDAFEQAMAEQKDVLESLEQAAEALEQNPATRDLAEAMDELDMGKAGEAAKKLADELGMQSPAQRKQTADALEQAGKELARSGDPSMQQAGEAMQQAAQAARGDQGEAQQGQEGEGSQGEQGEGQQGEGSAGQQAGAGGQGMSREEAEQLAEALERARQQGEQLARDREALERSQELNGALEGSRQRLGGDPSMDEGESEGSEGNQSGQGQGTEDGEGQGEGGEGGGEGMGQAGSGVGSGHTWEDQGEFDKSEGSGEGERQDGARDEEGRVINDFERLYRSVRDEDAEHLLTSVEGRMDDRGQVDELPVRLTGSDEEARTAAVQLPAEYREAAAEAVSSEQVPPGYREAVKQYFDEME